MDDRTKRYLRQQIEIGGRELVLSQRDEAPKRSGQRAKDPASEREPEVAGQPKPAPVHQGKPTQTPKQRTDDWRVGAPAIPGPGVTIEAPTVDLLSPRKTEWSNLDAIAQAIKGCERCFLCKGRTNTVPGEGNPNARLLLVGEGPGQTEDETGRPFVGRAGELLNGILKAIGFQRDEVFICNVVKCRPPQNRKPLPDEIAECLPYLEAQIGLVKPAVILALGATAAETMLATRRSLSDLRGKVHSYRGIPLIVTYHPAALLRNPNWKKPTWDDVRIARQLIDR